MLSGTPQYPDDFASHRRYTFLEFLARRRTVFVATYIAYVGCYLVRNNTKVISELLTQEMGWTPREIGYILTGFTLTYGLGKVLMGIVVDRRSVRLTFATALGVSALVCWSMGFMRSIPMMITAMAVIGMVQGAAAPAALTTIGAWYPNQQRGSRVAVWNTSQNLGAALLPMMIAAGLVLVGPSSWQVAYWLPALFAFAIAVWFYRAGADRPWQEGMPTLTRLYGDAGTPRLPQTMHVSYWRMIRVHVLTNRLLVILATINMLLYLARFGILNWMPIYLARERGLTLTQTSTAMAVLEWGAILGALAYALIAWRLPNRMATAGGIGVIALALVIWSYSGAGNYQSVLVHAVTLGALTYGPQVIVNILTVNFVSPRATGVAVGIVGLAGYLVGEVVANLAIPALEESLGWRAGFVLLVSACLICAALYFSLRRAEQRVVFVGE